MHKDGIDRNKTALLSRQAYVVFEHRKDFLMVNLRSRMNIRSLPSLSSLLENTVRACAVYIYLIYNL